MKKKYSLLLTASFLVFSTKLSYGQAPTLGVTDSFALFTAVGAFTLNGANVIIGDVGTNKGAFTIPGSLSLTGTQHVQDSISGLAATNVATAYTELNSLSCDSTLNTPMGNNRVLVPGVVYCISSAASLNGNLILDGQNSTNAIFNINIDGALSTDSASTVTLINGASCCNVFWQVNGAVELGISSVFNGTVIANGAITLLNQARLNGRALSTGGSIITNKNNALGCDAAGYPLPIQLIKFTAKPINDYVLLDWSTASEINNNYFTVQRSQNLINFEALDTIAGAGNSSKIINYSFVDHNPYGGSSYYRLMQTDFDGQFTYSNVVKVNAKKVYTISVYPNPLGVYTTILLKEAKNSEIIEGEFWLCNSLGELIMIKTISEQMTILNKNQIIAGIYFYKIIIDKEIIQSGKLISQ